MIMIEYKMTEKQWLEAYFRYYLSTIKNQLRGDVL